MTEWTVRQKIISIMNQWYLIFLAFIVSAGVAWGGIHIWPSQHQASTTVYVGIEIKRVFDVSSMATYAKTEPFNIDDYKNWQLSQLESMARSEIVAKETLAALREVDPYWMKISPQEFQTLQSIAWRDMGTWRLTISLSDPERAAQAVKTWSSEFVEYASSLISKADSAFSLDGELRALNVQQVGLKMELSEFERIEEGLTEFQSNISRMDEDQTLDPLLRWELWGLTTGPADHTPLWTEVLDQFPEADERSVEYMAWIESFLGVLSTQKEINQETLMELEQKEEALTERFVQETQKSKGLSSSLYIENAPFPVSIHSVSPDALAALLGGCLGVIIYLMGFMIFTEIKGNKER
ncbi:MAG: hypothetical protein R6U51_05080 [Anaerolineales bacterium]